MNSAGAVNFGQLGLPAGMKVSRIKRVTLIASILLGIPLAVWLRSFGGKEPHASMPPSDHTVKRALFVMAHPDDEFGIYGRMLQLRDHNTENWCVWTSAGNTKSGSEAICAMREVGIPEERLLFLNVGGLADVSSVEKTIKALGNLLATHVFDEIYVVAFEGGHRQHDLTHFATIRAVALSASGSRVYEFPLYNLCGARINPFRLIPAPGPVYGITLDAARIAFIRSLTRHYPSKRLITEGFLRFMPYSRQCQPRWRPVPAWDYTAPPHQGLLWYDANPRHFRERSYRKSVCDIVKAYYRENNISGP